jgi:exodeoxyribonuclease VII small subunit
MSDDIDLTYEQALQELEEIVASLEHEGLELAETLALYERGKELSRYCQGLLDAVELRVQQVSTGENGEVRLEPLARDGAV